MTFLSLIYTFYFNIESRHFSHSLLFIHDDDETYDSGNVESKALDRGKNKIRHTCSREGEERENKR